MASRMKLREQVKLAYVEKISEFLSNEGEEMLRVGSNQLAFPVTDSEGNEDFVVIVVKIPTGANKGTEPYDGYAMAEDYAIHLRENEEKAEKAAKDKAKKIEKDKIYRQKQAEAKAKRGEQ